MYKLIPPYYRENYPSKAEIKVFEIFKKLDGSATVLHSLGMADHNTKVFGEMDFVIISEQGILCLEVKGGYVSVEKGVWIYEDRNGNKSRSLEGPFKQVVGNMLSLRNFLRNKLGTKHPVSKTQFACGVIFPDMTFNRSGIEIIPEIVFDNRLRDEQMHQYIYQCFQYWKGKIIDKHQFGPGKLHKTIISQLENLFRGDFACIPSLGSMLNEVDRQLVSLTRDQFVVLQMMSLNPRMMIKGRAGTGKTLIALEQARRLVLQGKRVLYLCFNRVISSYLKFQMRQEVLHSNGGALEITNFHEYLGRFVHPLKNGNNEDYYKTVLPEAFLDYVFTNNDHEKFDVILIDEGQDLLNPSYLYCLDEILTDKLERGSWYIFYDDNQNLYNAEYEEGQSLMEEFRPAHMPLLVNCRNTKQIGTYNRILTGFDHGEIMKIEGEHVTRQKYDTDEELKDKIINRVKFLLKEGIHPSDIVILSPCKLESSALKSVDVFKSVCKFQDISSQKYATFSPDSVKYCTIQSFKGMESKVVLLIDLKKFIDPDFRRLNYTAISRARTFLDIYYHSSSEEEVVKISTEVALRTVV